MKYDYNRRFKRSANLLLAISQALSGKKVLIISATSQDEAFKQTLTIKVLNSLQIPYKLALMTNEIKFPNKCEGVLKFKVLGNTTSSIKPTHIIKDDPLCNL